MDEFIIQELIAGCKKKDRKSQKGLYQLFYSYAMRMCIRYAKDKDEAIELVNDGFMRVFIHIHRYEEKRSFKAWLSTIMINTSIDHYRKQIKRIEMEELNARHEMEDKESILSHIHYEELIKLVQRLSVAYRTVFNLFAIDGYTHEEISSMLSISVGTSKSNLFKAREQLKKMLKQHRD
ncbi:MULTISPECIES: RNA polymerase sigma factor [Pedobacter]|uniref:RNA polymerase sigma factor, sigma-70 family n=1 Tax=Pedobacter heparinus (strain ATCC 13125 / DSM 2366 / CIP 104194 / JCM 7457 / NBRC 12017 / NCIMB 9290 / NRRL B-14731 / HIM 762-3) TaxID=485917 RepID=C6Y453_PEDHD|nr:MULTISPECIES: RNA polymerase sigma factor [Pedobacter]ACU05496.1 RNA polymerase sigma factor, sigma-70 family [Pedobacter heparinus DSM 2366]MBB5440541.1 RNA polymerase sigma-70 factor (ECF subfamily) [Pedobacter sp. AK017]